MLGTCHPTHLGGSLGKKPEETPLVSPPAPTPFSSQNSQRPPSPQAQGAPQGVSSAFRGWGACWGHATQHIWGVHWGKNQRKHLWCHLPPPPHFPAKTAKDRQVPRPRVPHRELAAPFGAGGHAGDMPPNTFGGFIGEKTRGNTSGVTSRPHPIFQPKQPKTAKSPGPGCPTGS